VIPRNSEEFERALAAMLGDPRLRENRRQACHTFVKILSWEGPESDRVIAPAVRRDQCDALAITRATNVFFACRDSG